MAEIMGLDIERLENSGFRIEGGGKVVYFDPFKLDRQDEADIVLISHEHFDHCSPEDIEKVSGSDTILVVNSSSLSKVSDMEVKDVIAASPGKSLRAAGLDIETVAAYNTNKFRTPGHPFHPKDHEHCGYIIDFDGVRVYHAGDTDVTDEMYDVQCDIAIVPVSGTYVMTAEEAAKAVKRIKPKLAIPTHYGSVAGSVKDAEKFKELADCEVEII